MADGYAALSIAGLAKAAGVSSSFELPDGVTPERAIDMLWTLNSPEIYDRLVRRCGWARSEYEAWLAAQLKTCLLPARGSEETAPHPAA